MEIRTRYVYRHIFQDEDKTKFVEEYEQASRFAYDLFKNVLTRYKLHKLYKKKNDKPPKKPSVNRFCEHIADSVVALSFINRLMFRMFFEHHGSRLLEPNSCYYEKLILIFCMDLYIEGFVEQFLIICGFIIDLIVFLHVKSKRNVVGDMSTFFGNLFRFFLRNTFFQKGGGWDEVKIKCKPWWHTYRNIIYEQEESKVYKIDFHQPLYELGNDNLYQLLKKRGFKVSLDTAKTYPSVPLLVPQSQHPERRSPICES